MSPLEWFAAALGLVAVWLTVREQVAAWPIGAVMVALYVYIFASAKLYADAGLQVIYFVLQFYGWYQWLRGGTSHTTLHVSRSSRRTLALCTAIGTLGTLGLGWLLARHTDQALPFWDSGIAAFSLVTQWMLARKLLENWIFWFLIDIVAVGVYATRGLVATTILYAVYIGLAVAGYRTWKTAMAEQVALRA
jgi:nicotinamide mononucleotide transporter